MHSHMKSSGDISNPPGSLLRLRLSKDGQLLLFGMIYVLIATCFVPIAKAAESPTAFDWHGITPSPKLTWVKCYATFECARLEVPLDYSVPTGDKAAVAMIRVKAKVSANSKRYRGPVLFNPGGPGGSGISYVFGNGKGHQRLLGEEYDIIGFDPRGIGETTPKVSVFSDDAERALWDAGAPPLLNSTPSAFPRAFLRAQEFNSLIESRSKRAAEHVSTAVVARDMLSITKAHGRDRLQYWGISYGSVLGATYAAMFPDNVERLVIDGLLPGVGDFDDYYSGSWSSNLLDTDKELQILYDSCARAGPACPLQANSSALVQQRVEALFASIKENPLPVINGTDYDLIEVTMLKEALLNALYSPFQSFPPLALAFAALEHGDGLPFFSLSRQAQQPPVVVTILEEAGTAVRCGDGEGADNSVPGILQYFQDQNNISVFADIWTLGARIRCADWKVRPKERFAGPFTVNTSFPLLIIGNTADPVTPLAGAQKAARNFGGSALLTINTPGHGSQIATSLCATKIIHDYFTRGQLPDVGTVCEIESVLFGETSTTSQNLTARDVELMEVANSITRNLRAPRSPRFL